MPSQFYANRSAIQPLAIQGADIKPANEVSQHPFHGLPHEKPLDHIETLEDFVSGIKEHEGTKDYILCKLFRYSLSGNAVNWLKLLSPGSLTTWNEVKSVFLTEFVDHTKGEEMMNRIWTFSQGPTEAFRNSWDRFKRYQRDCPHHGFLEVQLLQIFYMVIDVRYNIMLDTAREGNSETKTPEKAKKLMENLVSSNSTKNLELHRMKSTVMDGDKIVEADIGSVHEVSLVEHAVEKDENQRVLEIQQKTSAYLNLGLDVVHKELYDLFSIQSQTV